MTFYNEKKMAINQKLIDYIKVGLARRLSEVQIKQNLLAVGWTEIEINEAINYVKQERLLAQQGIQQTLPINKQLIDYVKICLERGASSEQIKPALVGSGWGESEINDALEIVKKQMPLAADISPGNMTGNIAVSQIMVGGEKSSEGRNTLKLILIIGIFLVMLSIIGVVTFFVLGEKESGAGEGIIDNIFGFSKCKANIDCGEGYECKEEKCVEVQNKEPASGGSPRGSTTSGQPNLSSGGGGGGGPQIKDCGNDFGCFIEASKSCEPAKVEYIYTAEIFGVEKTTTAYYELKGIEADKCIFYMKTGSIDIKYIDELIQQMKDSGISQEAVSQKEQVENIKADSSEGKDATCKILTSDLTDTLNTWKTNNLQVGTFSAKVWKYSGCIGSYFS